MRLKKFFLNYGYAYLCYYALGNFLVSLLPIFVIWSSKITRIRISKTYFILVTYMIFASTWSLSDIESRNVVNFITSQKTYIFILCYILVFSSNKIFSPRDVFAFSSRFMNFFLPAAAVVSLITSNIHIFGLRGDVGILLCFIHFFSAIYKLFIKKNISLYFIELSLLIYLLSFLQGRTSFGVLIICLLFIFGVKRLVFKKKSILDIPLLIISVTAALFAGIILFNARGGIEYVQTTEARTLALIYWYQVMLVTTWPEIIFGHGYGTCVDHIVGSHAFSQSHINQIKASSGQDCYVSWGFHNTILSLIYELGLLFFFLLSWHLNKIRKQLNKSERVGFWFLVSIILVASPNNHFVNHDVIGFVIFSALAYLERRGTQQNAYKKL